MFRQLVCCVALLIQSAVASTQVTVRWAVFEFNPIPFQYHDQSEAFGPDIDIIREIFSNLDGYSLNERVVPVARAAHEYPRGGFDFVLLLKTPQMDKISIYSDTPLRWIIYKLAIRSDKELIYNDINSLKNLNIGVVSGTPMSGIFAKAINKQVFNVVGLKDYENLLEMLKRGRIDAIYGSLSTLERKAAIMGVDIKIVKNTPSVVKGYYPTLSKNSPIKNKEHLLNQISNKLLKAHNNGSIEQIYQSYGISKNEYWPEHIKSGFDINTQ